MSPSDEEIARQIRRGHPGAFGAFFDQFSGPLLGYLVGLVGDHALAEDLLQETMLRVYRRIDRYQERGAFRAWVFRIATNLAFTELRRHRLITTEALDERVLQIPDRSAIDAQERLESEERTRILQAGMETLADEQRAVLLLRVHQGMDLREIAETLCVPEGTVKSRIHHAVRKLREFVDHREYQEIKESKNENVR